MQQRDGDRPGAAEETGRKNGVLAVVTYELVSFVATAAVHGLDVKIRNPRKTKSSTKINKWFRQFRMQ